MIHWKACTFYAGNEKHNVSCQQGCLFTDIVPLSWVTFTQGRGPARNIMWLSENGCIFYVCWPYVTRYYVNRAVYLQTCSYRQKHWNTSCSCTSDDWQSDEQNKKRYAFCIVQMYIGTRHADVLMCCIDYVACTSHSQLSGSPSHAQVWGQVRHLGGIHIHDLTDTRVECFPLASYHRLR